MLAAATLIAIPGSRTHAQDATPAPPAAGQPPKLTPTPASKPAPEPTPKPAPPGGEAQYHQLVIDPTTGQPLVGVAPEKRFDLVFPGGHPRELIDLLSKARERAVNAIIPGELANTSLPPMRLKQVTLAQVFEALQAASRKTVVYTTGTYGGFPGSAPIRQYQQRETSFGFKTAGNNYDEDAIWYFYRDQPPESEEMQAPETVRFYQMARFLDTYKIDDITTAIQTGWKLGGQTELGMPQLSFHKETKLLIVRARPELLQVIDDVLKELDKGLQPASAFRAQPIPGGLPAPKAVPPPTLPAGPEKSR